MPTKRAEIEQTPSLKNRVLDSECCEEYKNHLITFLSELLWSNNSNCRCKHSQALKLINQNLYIHIKFSTPDHLRKVNAFLDLILIEDPTMSD